MRGWNLGQYIIIELNIFAALIVVVLFVLAANMHGGFAGRRVFMGVLATVFFILIFDMAFWISDRNTFAGARTVNVVSNFFYYAAQRPACCLFGIFCMKTAKFKLKPWQLAVYFIPLVFSEALTLINLGANLMYSIDQSNVYSRLPGVWYPLYTVSTLGYMLMCFSLFAVRLFFDFRRKTAEGRDDNLYMTTVLLIPFIGTAIQTIFYGVTTIWISGVFTLILVFARLQGRQALKVERELSASRIAAMRSQIQPHFIFNILTTIRRLIGVDPARAENAVLEFSKYLRNNIDSISDPAPADFSKELEFIETYIALEKMRFGNRLKFEKDIKTSAFTLPMLSVQPLVENAVRYGVSKRKDGGTVTLSAKESGDAFIITVKDDGEGFDVEKTLRQKDGHTGIENARTRIEEVCKGKLTIQSKVGEGTEVRIVIPKK